MLGWKYFCLIYLLLLYQLQYVLAEVNALAACSITNIDDSSCTDTSANNTDTYCLSNGFIYRVTTDGECVSKITSSVHVFDGNKKEVDLTVTGKIKDTDVENYSMYACSASECTQTSGYIKINDFFEKSVGEEDDWNKNCSTNYFFFEDNNGFELFRKSNGKCVLTYDDAYRKKGTVYYFINQADETTIIVDTNTKKEAGPLNVSELSSTSDLNKYYVYKCQDGYCKIIIGHNIINISTMKIIDVTD
ncbi:hypothetical protein U3516DRAFT_481008, partial [Neocallimastix sp. 'constans']